MASPLRSVVALLLLLSWTATARADLKGYWSFDDGSGLTATDSSGQGNHGTIENWGAPNWVSGFSGNPGDSALNFTGGAQRVNAGNPADLSTDIAGSRTTSIWFQPSALPGARYSIWGKSYSGTGTLNVTSLGAFQQYYGPETSNPVTGNSGTHTNHISANGVIAAGNWYHIVHQRDSAGSTQQYYINGQPLASPAAWTLYNPTGVSAAPFLIGNGYTGTVLGILDDAAIWNEALSPGEIAALFAARADGANALNQLGYNVDQLDELFQVHEDAGSSTAQFDDGLTWAFQTGFDVSGHDLGDAWELSDGSVFLFLDGDAFSGVLGTPPPEVPEPTSLALFGVVLMGAAGYHWRRRRSA